MGNALKKKSSEKDTLTKKLDTARCTGVLNLEEFNFKNVSNFWSKLSNDQVLLTKLRSLDISNNSMKTLPPEISLMVQLKTFNATRCNIQKVNNILNPLTRLQILDLSYNDLEVDTIEAIPLSLNKINLSCNHFSGIPSCLFPLIHLIELDLSGNRIESMMGIGALSSLILLNLDDNFIVEISDDACQLIKLKKISLKNNKINKKSVSQQEVVRQSIPESFFTETTVENIDLTGNLLCNQDIMQFHGVDMFLERRKKMKDKALQGGALTDMSIFGLS